jgi:hypothetical protein
MRSMQQQLGVLGTISAFAFRHRETKKNLCRSDQKPVPRLRRFGVHQSCLCHNQANLVKTQ